MNKKFIVTATTWVGEVELCFSDDMLVKTDPRDENMLLIALDMRRAELTEAQHVWFLKNSLELASFFPKIRSSPNVEIVEVSADVTFEMFWKKYAPLPGDMHRNRTKAKWARMKTAEQIKAYNFIDKYNRNRESWQNKQNVITYLNGEGWNN